MLLLNRYYKGIIEEVSDVDNLYVKGLITSKEAETSIRAIGVEMFSDLKLTEAKLRALLIANIRETNKEKDSLIVDVIINIYINNIYGLSEEGAEVSALINYALYLATNKFYLTIENYTD